MKKHVLIWMLVILLVPTMACGLFGGSDEDDSDSASSQVSLNGGEAAEEPEAPPAVEESEEVTEPSEEEAPPASEESTEEEAPAAPAEPDGEEAPAESESAEFTGITNLDSLSSYQIRFVMSFDGTSGGQPSVGQVEMVIRSTKEPAARQLSMSMEGSTVDELGGANRVEFYEVGDTIYLYNDVDGGQWVSMPAGEDGGMFEEGFFVPEEDLPIPDTATCTDSSEMVNGAETKVCTFSQDDVAVEDVTFESLEGQVWLDKANNYIVKFNFKATGYQAAGQTEGLFDFGNVEYEYNLTDINSDFEITVPEEALNAEELDFGGLGGGMATDDVSPELPVLDDAEELFSMAGMTTYYTNTSVPEVIDFYRQELSALGWTEDEAGSYTDEQTGLVSFEKDNQMLMLTAGTEEDGRTNVGLIQAEQ